MGLKEIVHAMEEEAAARLDEIARAAESEERSIIAEAEEEARKVRESRLARARERVDHERERLLSAARLQARRELSVAREAYLERAFAGARERLARLRAEASYERALERLAREAVAELGTEIKIEVDPKDENLMKRIVQAVGIEAEIVASLTSLSGLRASAADGSISIVNTIEARLERAREELRQELSALLSTEEVSWRVATGTGTQAEGDSPSEKKGRSPWSQSP